MQKQSETVWSPVVMSLQGMRGAPSASKAARARATVRIRNLGRRVRRSHAEHAAAVLPLRLPQLCCLSYLSSFGPHDTLTTVLNRYALP